jgi:hypothetical protein
MESLFMRQEEKIVREIKAGRFKLSFHAAIRMAERRIQIEDIIEIARTCRDVIWQPARGTYRIQGQMLDQETGLIVARYDEALKVLIVTLMPRRKGR